MLTISTVASQLGVSPDVLRKWESRHGWPVPCRTPGGTRLYDETQLHQLRKVKRIIESGCPVGQAIALACMDAPLPDDRLQSPIHLDQLLGMIADGRFGLLRSELLAMRATQDAITFVEACAAPLMHTVGQHWARGRLRVWHEHAASAVMGEVLRQPDAGEQPGAPAGAPLVLLTTPPGERHTLGLSMARLILHRLGARCVDLGAETPLDDLAAAAHACDAQIVGLSVSRGFAPRALHAYSEALRDILPNQCALWLGGSGATRRGAEPGGIFVCGDASSIQLNLQLQLTKAARMHADGSPT